MPSPVYNVFPSNVFLKPSLPEAVAAARSARDLSSCLDDLSLHSPGMTSAPYRAFVVPVPTGGVFPSMAAARRNLSLAALMLALVAAAALALPSAMWACLVATVLGLAGVVLFRGNRWRSGALLAAAVALSLALLDAFAGLLTPTAYGAGLVRKVDPRWWPPPHPVLGFRPKPDSTVVAHRHLQRPSRSIDTTYHIDCEGGRATPRRRRAPTSISSWAIPSCSARASGRRDLALAVRRDGRRQGAHGQLGAPGNAPNHLVRAFEAGLLDRYAGQRVKAVVVWIIPAQLARVTGDGSWLGSSPRYDLVEGKLVHTGSFTEYRFSHPITGLKYLLGQHFPFVEQIGRQQRQDEQLELFVAMMARLQQFAREKFNAPLVVIYSWPDEKLPSLSTAIRSSTSPAGRRPGAAAQARHPRWCSVDDLASDPIRPPAPHPARWPSVGLHQRADLAGN